MVYIKELYIRLFLMVTSLFVINFVYSQKLIKVDDGYSGTSINTAVFRNNSIISHRDYQFISYYDADGFIVIGKRKLGEEKWTLKKTKYKGRVKDAHNVISMIVDGEGYIHLSFDHHCNKLNYCKSVEPLSLELSEKTVMIGTDEDSVTYPEFYLLPDGDLIFAYRTGNSGDGKMIMNRYSLTDKSWYRVQDVLIDGEGERNAYWQMCIDNKGVIHVSWVWRETGSVETNHDLCYARSYDKGKTWKKSTGEEYVLPITYESAEYVCKIPQKSELINQTSMSTDFDGNPYIASYWKSEGSLVPQYRVIYNDGKEWHVNQISNRESPFTLKGAGTKMIPISRPRIVTDGVNGYYIFRDIERGSKVSIAITDDMRGNKWRIYDLTNFSVNAWEPTYDTELWKNEKKLHIFVQNTGQGDGGGSVNMIPQPVYVLEVDSALINGKHYDRMTPYDITSFRCEELIYKTIDTTKLKMSIVYPQDFKEGDERPAIVFFFGGGWIRGSLTQFLTQSLELAKRGMIAIMAEYRVSERHGTSPKECVCDARSAMRFVRKNAKKLGINPNKIAAGGGSAGGHLAASTAVISTFDDKNDDLRIDPSPNALVLFNPVLDNGPDGGWAYDRVSSYYKLISPAHNIVSGLPPTLFMVGTNDKLIPMSTAIRYQKNMEKAGNKCDLFFYASEGHGFFNYKNGNNSSYYRTVDAMISFFNSLGFIKSK